MIQLTSRLDLPVLINPDEISAMIETSHYTQVILRNGAGDVLVRNKVAEITEILAEQQKKNAPTKHRSHARWPTAGDNL